MNTIECSVCGSSPSVYMNTIVMFSLWQQSICLHEHNGYVQSLAADKNTMILWSVFGANVYLPKMSVFSLWQQQEQHLQAEIWGFPGRWAPSVLPWAGRPIPSQKWTAPLPLAAKVNNCQQVVTTREQSWCTLAQRTQWSFLTVFQYGSPWYNWNGWLGIKHQLTYLLPIWCRTWWKAARWHV